MPNDLTLILCIPGQWKDRFEIIKSLTLSNPEYILAGPTLLHTPTNDSFEVDIYEFDDRMRAAFEIAGDGRLSDTELDLIDKHTFTVYVIGKAGGLEEAEKIMNAGQAFLKAGGLGIKVESSGKAFSKEQWAEFIQSESEGKYYEVFVDLVQDDDIIYSCGMHNLGLHDTICELHDDNIEEATELVGVFNFYQLIDKPKITSGQTFGVTKDAPRYTIIEEDCTFYEEDDFFYNPFGMYHLKLNDIQ